MTQEEITENYQTINNNNMNHFANNGKEYLRKETKKTHYKDFKWKMPGDITKYIGERDKTRDTSMNGQKKRLEGQLELRKKYVELLENKEKTLKNYIAYPNEDNKLLLDIANSKIDAHNIRIEIISQKNVYVDTYIYYKEDFMKRFESGEEEKKVNDYKKK